jgi:phosphatidylglycerophosphatase C
MAQERSTRTAKTPRPIGPLVAFDFDGTLTVRDSFVAFLQWRAGPARFALGALRLLPAAAAYLVHRDRGRFKAQALTEFMGGVPQLQFEAEAEAFAEKSARKLLRPDALAAWRRWRAEGACLVIVSASPEPILSPFARRLGADDLIATQVGYVGEEKRLAGAFASPNCRGPEKVVRLRKAFGADVHLKAAYGDSSGDREMLELAEIRGYRVFKATP